ncbi:hypothetical protein CHS0354_023839 [Potamilus streckersoni]|uniref:Purine nucleoside phosphorylase n=1 Tax=Potamilus streckersoni TaxID=2493646 RepID=A0AAE0VLH7_9BIVA|nr:hypothetical protein CHS0354_023839 [Potamilus streckersoni]
MIVQVPISNTLSFARGNQIHSNSVAIVTDSYSIPTADALITTIPNLLVSVLTADCTPILLLDTKQNIVAAIHAGWKGTLAHVVTNTLQILFNTFGTKPNHIYAYIGACISAKSYEVGEDVFSHFNEKFLLPAYPNAPILNSKRLLDLKAANYAQLVESCIPPTNIEVSPYCTYQQHTDFFSYRYENGKTGRMISFIGIAHV